jgi:hypothetical protein
MLAPGSPTAALTIDFTTPGAYEYPNAVGCPSGDAFAEMKGVLDVTYLGARWRWITSWLESQRA